MQIQSQRQQQPLPTGPVRGAQPTVAAAAPGGPANQAASPIATKPQSAPAPTGPAKNDAASNVARLDGFTEALMERFSNAAQNAPESELPAFREAFANMESGLSRLRAGLSDGSLQAGDVQRGLSNVFQGVRDVLEAGRADPTGDTKVSDDTSLSGMDMKMDATRSSMAADASRPAGPSGPMAPTKPMDADDASVKSDAMDEAPSMGDMVQSRFSGFAESVLSRLSGLDMPDDQRSAMADSISEAFASATARLDAALFNPQSGESIDRGTYQQLFSASLGALQDQLGRLFGGNETPNGGVVYGADRSKEGLAQSSYRLNVDG